MAIDTAERRRNVAGVGYWIGLGVTPNASKDVEWRQQVGWGYSGIAPSGELPTGDLGWLPRFLKHKGSI